MNVHELAITAGENPRCFAPIPLQIGLDVETGQARYTVATTQDWSGIAVVIGGKTLLRHLQSGGRQIPVDLMIEWEQDKLHFDHTGPFANLSALLIADQTGVTSIDVSILQPEPLNQGEVKSEESASTGSFRILAVNLTLSSSLGDPVAADVGANVVPRRTVIGGSTTYFDPNLSFDGELSLRDISDKSCTLGHVRQPVDRNDDNPGKMGYEWRDSPGPPSAARFEVPRMVRLSGKSAVSFPPGGFKLIHARRPGTMNLTTTMTVTDSRYDAAFGLNATDVYQINPFQLSFTVDPAPADNRNGKLLFEDRWLELADQPHGGRLVSSFHLEVKRGTETLYQSWKPAILEMQLQNNLVFIESLVIEDEDGLRNQLPFRLLLTSSAPNIVEFWQPSEEVGKASVRRTLDDIMAAIDSGPCDIEVTIMNFNDPIPLNVDVYDMPRPNSKILQVEIPPPLEADLTLWEDAYFAGANAMPLGAGDEVIYSSGTISGKVVNRKGAVSEQISLTRTAPPAAPENLSLTFGSGATQRELFERQVTGLSLGANEFKLTAEKPINRARNGGPSTDSATLTGVRPRDVTLRPIDGQQIDASVVRRDFGRFAYGYTRAVRATLKEICGSTPHDIAAYGQSYGPASDNQHVTLRQETGVHTLRLVAENDFGPMSSPDFRVNARAPEFTPEVLTSSVPHDPTDSRHVGNSVSRVDLQIRARYCLTYDASMDGTSFHHVDPADPLQQSEETSSAPAAPRRLAVGLNTFTFSFGNEFSTGTDNLDVRRRDDVYDVAGELSMMPYDSRLEAVVEVVEVRPDDFANLPPGDYPGFNRLFSFQDLQSPIGFELIRWRVKDGYPDNDTDPETLDLRITFYAESIGPDFEPSTSFMDIDPADADTEDPDMIPAPISQLSDWSGLDLNGPNRYWTQARIWGTDDELWIPLLTYPVAE